jgi:ABC-2 type transport system permease protein
MTRKSVTVARKTLGDLADPRVLAAYLAVYLGVLFFLALALGNNVVPDGAGTLSAAAQERYLLGSFLVLTHLWAVGLGLLLFGAVAVANTLAKEAEAGTLRIVLSKQVRRWEVVLGTFLGLVGYLLAVAMANTLVGAAALFAFADLPAATLAGGVFGALPAVVLQAVVVAVLVAGVGIALGIATKSRLQTAIGVLAVAALYFVMMVVRLFSPDRYEDYHFYLPDVSYHLGNALVFGYETVVGDLPAEAQLSLNLFSGVYDVRAGADVEPLPESFELAGHVDPAVSFGVIVGGALLLLVAATVQFQRIDV